MVLQRHFVSFRVCLVAFLIRTTIGQCPNLCSGHGDCGVDKRCSCWRADKVHNTFYIGGDCSLRECPKGRAWVDVASGPDTAHGLVECSNAGTCNRNTGECKCLQIGEHPLTKGLNLKGELFIADLSYIAALN